MNIPLPRGHTLGVHTYRRHATVRSWLTVGPAFDDTDTVRGAAISAGPWGLAVYVMPTFWHLIHCDDTE